MILFLFPFLCSSCRHRNDRIGRRVAGCGAGWMVDGGRWMVDGGRWTVTVDSGRWDGGTVGRWDGGTVDSGQWTVDGGRWTVDGGRWTVDSGRWTVDGGRWTVGAVDRWTRGRVSCGLQGRGRRKRRGDRHAADVGVRQSNQDEVGLWRDHTADCGSYCWERSVQPQARARDDGERRRRETWPFGERGNGSRAGAARTA